MAVLGTTGSPSRISTAPLACSATLPVLTVTCRPPISNDLVTSATYLPPRGRPGTLQLGSKRASRPDARGLTPAKKSGGCPPLLLSPDPQLRDERAVALDVVAAQVVQQPASLADQEQEPAPRVVVLLVRLQVLGELSDALGEDRHLDLGRARVRVVEPVLHGQPR